MGYAGQLLDALLNGQTDSRSVALAARTLVAANVTLRPEFSPTVRTPS